MTDPTSPDITGALALLREAMRASPVPPAEILIFAGEACAAAGYPPTTPELDDKLRALGLLFGKAAPGPADLTHFLWHILEGNVPRALAVQALQLVQENSDFKGLSGVMTRNVLEAAREDIAAVYGGDMIKNLGLLLKSIARRAVEMTTAGMAGEVSAARSERTAAMQTIKALEADLTKIAKAYYGEEAPTGISADGIAEFIRGAHEAARALPATESALKAALETEDLRRQLNKAQAEASHQRDRAAKANGDIEVITAAYFKAGFGPSPTTPEKVAAAIGDLLAARERAKQKASDAEAHAARWRRACELAGWNPEHEPQKPDGLDKLVAFMERAQALLVNPLRDLVGRRPHGAPIADPARVVELAAERIRADFRELERLRAANHDLAAKIESAPGSGLRKRLKEAEVAAARHSSASFCRGDLTAAPIASKGRSASDSRGRPERLLLATAEEAERLLAAPEARPDTERELVNDLREVRVPQADGSVAQPGPHVEPVQRPWPARGPQCGRPGSGW